MATIRTWVSLEGGYFEGTQAALCKEYGIKHKTNLKRASGAPDDDGDRWMTKEQYDNAGFTRPTLYLGSKLVKNNEGTMTEVSNSGTGAIYLLAKNALANNSSHTNLELAQGVVDSYEKIFEIVDNTPVEGKKTRLNKLITEMYRWKDMRSKLSFLVAWESKHKKDIGPTQTMKKVEEVNDGMTQLFVLINAERAEISAKERAIRTSRAEEIVAKRSAVYAMHKALKAELGRELTLEEMIPACNEVGHTIFYVKNLQREANKAKRAAKKKLKENNELAVA